MATAGETALLPKLITKKSTHGRAIGEIIVFELVI
jgi:hypothetical protein